MHVNYRFSALTVKFGTQPRFVIASISLKYTHVSMFTHIVFLLILMKIEKRIVVNVRVNVHFIGSFLLFNQMLNTESMKFSTFTSFLTSKY